jgi:Ig-like domain CHU_C associated
LVFIPFYMKFLAPFVLFLLINCTTIAQSPSFVNTLYADSPFYCYGSNGMVLGKVANANYYRFQKKNEENQTWDNIGGASGDPTFTDGNISYTFSYLTAPLTVRVIISNASTEIVGNALTVSPQRPSFAFQPIDLTECNGSDVVFRVGAVGASQFLWEKDNSGGGAFTELNNSGKISGSSTSALKLTGLVNGDHLTYFRCRVKDAQGCENISQAAKLFVNQMPTVVSPTTATQFCEGDTARFYVNGFVGDTLATNWMIRLAGASTYQELVNTAKFLNVNSAQLTVIGITPQENSYRLKTTFYKTSQAENGMLLAGTCIKEATRANYIVNPRPAAPEQIEDVSRCGEGRVNAQVVSSYPVFWYEDTLKSALVSSNPTFGSPHLAETKPYYYHIKDAKGCRSFNKTFKAVVLPRPEAEVVGELAVCPTQNEVMLPFGNLKHNPDRYFVYPTPVILAGFESIADRPLSLNKLGLPALKNEGQYGLGFYFKNSVNGCFSDTSFVKLKIKAATAILTQPGSAEVCEGLPFNLSFVGRGEPSLGYNWYKDQVLIDTAKTPILHFEKLSLLDKGVYTGQITGQCGALMTNHASLLVKPQTRITKQPTSKLVCEKADAVFTVEATGSGVLTYQWWINDTKIGGNSSELKLENVSLALHKAKIKCEISSDCQPVVFSQEASLQVDDLPVAPTVNSPIGFCQNSGNQALVAQILLKHSSVWYNQNQLMLSSPLVATTQVDTLHFWVSQKDTNACESPKAELVVSISPAFTLVVKSDIDALCTTGNFNRFGVVYSDISVFEGNKNGFTHQLWKDDSFIEQNSSGEFEINTGGSYTIKSSRGFCEVSETRIVKTIGLDLRSNPIVADQWVCKNSDLTIKAGGDFSGGEFNWWANAFFASPLALGSTLEVSRVTQPQSYFVSYVNNYDGLYCESARKEVNVFLKAPPRVVAQIANQTCTNLLDGKIEIQSTTGAAPFQFVLNDTLKVSSGLFDKLPAGSYTLKVIDSEGCSLDTVLVVGMALPPQIITQPQSISRCKGNIANFVISAENYTAIKWQIKKPGAALFEDLPNTSSVTLRIENIGSVDFPYLSVFRAVVSKNMCQTVSQPATLYVNSISGSSVSQIKCVGESADFNLQSFTLIGNYTAYQWEFRPGTSGSWQAITGATQPTLSLKNLETSQSGYYRCKVIFDNGEGNTCVINTSTSGSNLSLLLPQIPVLSGSTLICKGQSATLTASSCEGTVTWSDGSQGLINKVSPTHTTYYTAICQIPGCSRSSKDSLKVEVNEVGVEAPVLVLNNSVFCIGDSVFLSASNCSGVINWSTGQQGRAIKFLAQTSFSISAVCSTLVCVSPASSTLSVSVVERLSAGEIGNNKDTYCAGYNPPTISSIKPPEGGNNRILKWQMAENCAAAIPYWQDIQGASSLSYDPPALHASACFRRLVADTCQDFMPSNISYIRIRPDPSVSVRSNHTEVCYGDNFSLVADTLGGVSPCIIQWQGNEVSSSESSAYWETLPQTAVQLLLTNTNSEAEKLVYFRAIFDCSLSSCNLSRSFPVGVKLYPKLIFSSNFRDSTICSGNAIKLSSLGCQGDLKWSTAATSPDIWVNPTTSQNYTVVCKTVCDSAVLAFNIQVLDGAAMPISTTSTSAVWPSQVQFSAVGDNLKWYTFEQATQPLQTAPSASTVGIHKYWVTQTKGNCESPKLEITTEILQKLIIEQSPKEAVNCKGNSATFEVQAKGAGILSYQWQRKRPGENTFTDLTIDHPNIEGHNTDILKIRGIGNLENPHETIFRCKVTDSLFGLVSAEAKLVVNGFSGSLSNQTLCEGQNLVLNLDQTHTFTGQIQTIAWQTRPGTNTDWKNLEEKQRITGAETLRLSILSVNSEDEQQYRCQIVFKTLSGTCIENTDLMTLRVGSFPATPNEKSFEFCQFEKAPKIDLGISKDLDVVWYTERNTTTSYKTQPQILTQQAGHTLLFYRVINKFECESKLIDIPILIHPSPSEPRNTTPSTISEGEKLIFSAEGENLKWFTSRTGKNYTVQSPEYQKIGKYAHYVSQTNQFECESSRLLINASIIESFGFAFQPQNQSNCEGNTSTFSVKVKGAADTNYQWQIWRNETQTFENLAGQTAPTLKITNVGSKEYPHNTTFRCKITSEKKDVFSNAAQLYVNQILSVVPDISVCENGKLHSESLASKIMGTINQIEWQKKQNTAYSSVFTETSLFPETAMQIENQGMYRLRISFKTSSGTCVRSSNDFTIKVLPSPKPIHLTEMDVCENESIERIMKRPSGNTLWFDDNQTQALTSLSLDFKAKPLERFWVAIQDSNSCESKKTPLTLYLKPKPRLTFADTLFTVCQFSNPQSVFSLLSSSHPVLWFSKATDDEPLKSFDSSEPGLQNVFVANYDNEGCVSDKKAVAIKTQTCYLENQKDSCWVFYTAKVPVNQWHYFHTADGRLAAAIQAENESLENVEFSFSTTNTFSKVLDKSSPVFYPRYFSISGQGTLKAKVKARFFLSETEIKRYKKHTENTQDEQVLVLKTQTGVLGCNQKMQSNALFSIIDKRKWQLTPDTSFRELAFDITEWGGYVLWENDLPKAVLTGSWSSSKKPLLEIEHDSHFSDGFYALHRWDGKNNLGLLKHFRVSEKPLYSFLDNKARQGRLQYKLVYHFGNGISIDLNSATLEYAPLQPSCFVFENPTSLRTNVNFYFPEIKKNTLKVVDGLGKTLPVDRIENKEDFSVIYFKTLLPNGLYHVWSENADGQTCSARFVVKD